MKDKELTAVSLFSGAGGMDVGFEQAGIKILMANEIDKMAANTFVKNQKWLWTTSIISSLFLKNTKG